MTRYAADTTVTADRSRAEIERILERYGAVAFMYGWDGTKAQLSFDIEGRRYRIALPLPDKAAPEFTRTPKTRELRAPDAARAAWEQATRQRWRALALWIKAVLEASESGITTLAEAMQPFIVLPNGMTAGQWLGPQIAAVYATGAMPALLPDLGADRAQALLMRRSPNPDIDDEEENFS